MFARRQLLSVPTRRFAAAMSLTVASRATIFTSSQPLAAPPSRDPFGGLLSEQFASPLFADYPPPTFHISAHETKDGLDVELEVPRYKKADITVTPDLKRGVVQVEGQRKTATKAAKSHTSSGVPSFKRSFSVCNQTFDIENLSYNVEDGLLVVHIPREQEPPEPELPAQDVKITLDATKASEAAGTKEVAKATSTVPAAWPPKFQVVQKPEGGVAVRYSVALPASVHPDAIELTMTSHGNLHVKASYMIRREAEQSTEEHTGSFSREFHLPEGTKPEDIAAKFQDQQLIISVASH